MESANPYQPPDLAGATAPIVLPVERRNPKRSLAMILCGLTTALSLLFIYVSETSRPFPMPPPGIVLIIGTAMMSVVTALLTGDMFFSPLCCVGGMMSGVILAGLMKDWSYVSLEVTIPLSLAASAPALIIAWLRCRFETRKLPVT